MADIVTVGNALIDLLVTVSDDNPFCRVDRESHELCVKAGEKILAENVGFVLGGGACRVAIALQRLGFTSSIFAEIGSDELATRIRKTLDEERVDTTHLRNVEKTTSFTVGLNFQKERTLFTHHVESPHEFDFSSITTKWIYLASLGQPWNKAYIEVVAYKDKTGAKIACNPGSSQFVMGRESYMPILSRVDVLFLNKQEAQIVNDLKTEDVKELLQKTKAIGCSIVVITDGRNGSYAVNEEGKCYSIGIFEDAKVVERTGAGDAYAAGFLAALFSNKTVAEAMQWGSLNSGTVVTEFGGLSGLLRKDELMSLLEKEIPVAKEI